MTTIFKPGIKKILHLFYEEKKPIHVRELSRKTKLEGQSIIRYIKILEKNSLLQSKKQGNQKILNIKQNQEIFSIFALFDTQKFEKLPRIKQQAIKTFINNLKKQPVFIILFGSTAKESYNKTSDIDLLIVSNEKINTKNAEQEANALHAEKISTFQIKYEDFKTELKLKQDKVIQSALETGYPIWNRETYYETLKNERT